MVAPNIAVSKRNIWNGKDFVLKLFTKLQLKYKRMEGLESVNIHFRPKRNMMEALETLSKKHVSYQYVPLCLQLETLLRRQNYLPRKHKYFPTNSKIFWWHQLHLSIYFPVS